MRDDKLSNALVMTYNCFLERLFLENTSTDKKIAFFFYIGKVFARGEIEDFRNEKTFFNNAFAGGELLPFSAISVSRWGVSYAGIIKEGRIPESLRSIVINGCPIC